MASSGCVVVVVVVVAGCGGGGGHHANDAGGDARVDAAGTGDGGTFAIEPASYVVPIGRSQIFIATGATGFSVAEPGGGTIDASGTYVAPLQPGTYHVVATAGSATSTATVTVADFAATVLAGQLGGPGDVDAIGSAARLNTPLQLTGDAAGNVYFADAGNHVIRKLVLATGAVTTIAGSPGRATVTDGIGSAAGFYMPYGIVLDAAAGELYVSESGGEVIRRVDVATGAVTTIAGQAGAFGSTNGVGSAARFQSPQGLALDGTGILYVADHDNCTIRAIDLATATVSVAAGQTGVCTAADGSSPTLSGPTSIAYYGGGLYVADTYAIRRIAHGAATTVAGSLTIADDVDSAGTNARFGTLGQIVSDGAGVFYVGDIENGRVRKFDSTSTQVTSIGSVAGGDAGISRPIGLTAAAGTLYVSDQLHTIHSLDVATGVEALVAGLREHSGSLDAGFAQATFDQPLGMVADSGHIYVADYANYRIRTLDLASATSSLLAGSTSGLHDGTGAAAQLTYILGLALGSNGVLYAADGAANAIRQVTVPAGAVSTPFSNIANPSGGLIDATGTASEFYTPYGGVVVNGVLYVADQGNFAIRAVDLATTATTTLAGGTGTGTVDGVGASAKFGYLTAIASDGVKLYVADQLGAVVRSIDLATATVVTIAGNPDGTDTISDGIGTAATFGTVTGLTWDGAQSLYLTDARTGLVRRIYLPTRAVGTFAGVANRTGVRLGSITSAQFGNARATAQLAPGTLVISSFGENAILELAQLP